MRLGRVMLLVAALVSPARADNENQTRARAHFEIGNGMYRLGDYQGALREFAAGYELTKKPGFLINLGQTYRKLHDLSSARDMYQKYLQVTPPEDPSRAQVRQVLGDIEAELRAQPRTAPEPIPSPIPQLAPAVVAPPAVVAAPPKKSGRGNRGLQIGGIVLGVVGLGLVGGGAGAASLANGLAEELNDLDTRRATFDSAKDDRYQLDRTLEGALFGVGAAVALTGIILIAVGSR